MLFSQQLIQDPIAFRQIEKWFNPGVESQMLERYWAALEALESSDPEVWLLLAHDTPLQAEEFEHFRTHWLGEEGFWPSIPAEVCIERMRVGYRSALIAARENVLPMMWLWLTPFSGVDVFQVEASVGENAVAIIFVTSAPSPPAQSD